MPNDVILIGPPGVGKTTNGKLLAERLGWAVYELDQLRFAYYYEIGYDDEEVSRLYHEGGLPAIYRYWKPFEAYAAERVLADHTGCVITFGAGHSVYEDDALFRRVQQALAPYPNVVLLLPSPDPEESIHLLNGRHAEMIPGDFDFTRHFITHHSNHELAKIVVYTKDQTPDETCDEILRRVAV